MGEEYGERAPFQFFTDHIDEASPTPRARGAGASSRPSPRSPARRSPTRRTRATFERSKLTRKGDPRPARARTRAARAAPRAAAGRRRRSTSTTTRGWLRVRRGAVELLDELRAARTTSRPRAASVVADDARRRRVEDGGVRLPAADRGARPLSREVWPGRPFPLGADLGRPGHELLAVLRARRARRAVPLRRRRRGAHRAARAHRAQLARLPAGRRARASATATASTGPTTPERGPPLQPAKLLIDPYAKAIEGPSTATRPTCCPTSRPAADDADLELDDEDDAAGDPEVRRRRRALRLGGRPPAAAPVDRDRHLRGARQGLHQAPPGRAATTCAAPTPGWRPTRRSATCRTSASPRSSCCRSTTSPTSRSCTTRA